MRAGWASALLCTLAVLGAAWGAETVGTATEAAPSPASTEKAGAQGADAILFLFTAIVCGLVFRCDILWRMNSWFALHHACKSCHKND